MTELERLENRMAKLKADREAKVKDLEAKVDYYTQHEHAAMDKISAATTAEDATAYGAARAEKDLSADARAMYASRLEGIKKSPLIDKDDYEKTRDKVLADLEAHDVAAKEKAAALIAEIEKIAKENTAYIERGNALLKEWQIDIFDDPAPWNSNRTLINNGRLARYPENRLQQLVYDMRLSTGFTSVTGREIYSATVREP